MDESINAPDFPWNFWQPAKFHARMAEEAFTNTAASDDRVCAVGTDAFGHARKVRSIDGRVHQCSGLSVEFLATGEIPRAHGRRSLTNTAASDDRVCAVGTDAPSAMRAKSGALMDESINAPDFPWNFWQPAKFHARMAEEALRTPLPAMIASVLLAQTGGASAMRV